MCRTTVSIDVSSIRACIDNISLGSKCIKHSFSQCPCTSVRCIKTYTHSLKGIYGKTHKISHISVTSCCMIYRTAYLFLCGIWDISHLTIKILFYFAYNIFSHLFAFAVDEFNTIVIERIVAC